MVKPLGGRGKKAPYDTIQMRVPEPIKAQVQALIDDYRSSVLGDSDSQSDSDLAADCDACLKLVYRFSIERDLGEKLYGEKPTRDNVNLKRFYDWLNQMRLK